MATLIEAMQGVLANTYALYLKTQNYHWNVTGPYFNDFHELFGEQYAEMAEAIDDIAEHIRQMGAKVPASLEIFAAQSTIQAGNENLKALDMVADLAQSQKELLKALQAATDLAADNSEDVIEDFLISRMAAHKKQCWMLDSILDA